MAVVRTLAWNIEVYGPEKYGNWPNNARLATLIAAVVARSNANVVVVMELMSSVAAQIAFTINESIATVTGNPWRYVVLPARPAGDRESYAVLWQNNAAANFTITQNGTGADNVALSTVDFPNNFSGSNGRRAALATFRTTDTGNEFAVSVYHAPPNARAIQGLQALAMTPGLYIADNGGVMVNVPGRMLAGDYNLDVNTQPEYSWLTNPEPAVPPPTGAGQGAGTTAITNANSHLMNMNAAVATWGTILANWSGNPVAYRDDQYDNIFYASPAMAPAPAGGVIDLVAELMNAASPVRAVANTFVTLNPANQNPAFPFAFNVPLPLNVNLNVAAVAWMLARYGVSDHLPVFAQVTI